MFQKFHFHEARVETPQGVVPCSSMCIHDHTCYPRKEKRDVSPLFSCQKPALDVPLLCTPWQSSLTEPKEEVQDSERPDMKWFKGRSSSKLSLSSSFRHSSEAAVDGSKDEVQRDCERWQWLVPIGTNSLKDNLWLKIPLIPGCPTFWRGGSTSRRFTVRLMTFHRTKFSVTDHSQAHRRNSDGGELQFGIVKVPRSFNWCSMAFYLLCFPFAVSRISPLVYGQKLPVISQCSLYFTVRI